MACCCTFFPPSQAREQTRCCALDGLSNAGYTFRVFSANSRRPLSFASPSPTKHKTCVYNRMQVENVEKVLDGVRPFLSVAGGSINIQSLTGVSSIQVTLSSVNIGDTHHSLIGVHRHLLGHSAACFANIDMDMSLVRRTTR